jgi:hypothetical protein
MKLTQKLRWHLRSVFLVPIFRFLKKFNCVWTNSEIKTLCGVGYFWEFDQMPVKDYSSFNFATNHKQDKAMVKAGVPETKFSQYRSSKGAFEAESILRRKGTSVCVPGNKPPTHVICWQPCPAADPIIMRKCKTHGKTFFRGSYTLA